MRSFVINWGLAKVKGKFYKTLVKQPHSMSQILRAVKKSGTDDRIKYGYLEEQQLCWFDHGMTRDEEDLVSIHAQARYSLVNCHLILQSAILPPLRQTNVLTHPTPRQTEVLPPVFLKLASNSPSHGRQIAPLPPRQSEILFSLLAY